MLIRSQDEKYLVNFNQTAYIDYVKRPDPANDAIMSVHSSYDTFCRIARYSTIEKANAVLEDIEKAYSEGRFVYLMPQDDEV